MGLVLRDAQIFLLAAGRGRRAGGPKAWAVTDGKPALARHAQAVASAAGAVSASIQADWLGTCRELFPRVNWVAVDPDRPPLASLQALLAARRTDLPGFVYHVDMPVFEVQVFDALQASLDGCEACVATHQGRRGHPVLLSPCLYPLIARLDPDQDRLDEFLRERRVAEVSAGSAAVLENRNA